MSDKATLRDYLVAAIDGGTTDGENFSGIGSPDTDDIRDAGLLAIADALNRFRDNYWDSGGVPNHASTHENGGADEINVGGLSGELADPQPPKSHGNEAHDHTFAVDGDPQPPDGSEFSMNAGAQILADDGTSSRPGIAFEGDSNTGFGQNGPNGNEIRAIVGNSECVVFSITALELREGFASSVVDNDGDYTAGSDDYCIFFNNANGDTLYLPASPAAGQEIILMVDNAASGNVEVDGNGNIVNGATTWTAGGGGRYKFGEEGEWFYLL